MRCFQHPDRDAVGICKCCGKGLCPDCLTDLGKGLACRDRCEEQVRSVNDMIERNLRLAPATRQIVHSNRSARIQAALLQLVLGLVFLGWWFQSETRLDLTLLFGAVFLLNGGYSLFQACRMKRPPVDP